MNILAILVLMAWINVSISSEWADPTDLYNYDRHTKKMKKPDVIHTEAVSKILKNSDQNQETKQTNLISTINTNNVQCDPMALAQLFSHYKRIVNTFKKALIPSKTSNNYELNLKTDVKIEHFNALLKFSDSEVYNKQHVREMETIILEIIEDGLTMSYFDQMQANINWFIYSASDPIVQVYILIIIASLLLYFSMKGKFLRFKLYSLFLIFVVMSFLWTFLKLVEEEEIKLESERMQHDTPPNCNYHKDKEWGLLLTFLGGSLFGSNDACHKYVTAYKKTAWKAVTPSHVLSHMLGDFFSTFLDPVSKSITKMFFGFYDRFGFVHNLIFGPLAFVFIFFLCTLFMIFAFGRSFRIGLFGLFSYEILPRTTVHVPDATHLQRLQNRSHVEELSYSSEKIDKKITPKISSTSTEKAESTSEDEQDERNTNETELERYKPRRVHEIDTKKKEAIREKIEETLEGRSLKSEDVEQNKENQIEFEKFKNIEQNIEHLDKKNTKLVSKENLPCNEQNDNKSKKCN